MSSATPAVREPGLKAEKLITQLPEAPLEVEDGGPNHLDFEENDSDDPLNWPTWRKWIIVALISATRMLVYVRLFLRVVFALVFLDSWSLELISIL